MADSTIDGLTDGLTKNATDLIPVSRSPHGAGDNRKLLASLFESTGVAATADAAHVAAADPHTQYTLTTELTSHEGAANPHPGYLTPAEGDAAYQPLSSNLTEYAGVNPTAAGLALLDDADTAAQLVSLGLAASATELNYTDGVTSSIQTQLNALGWTYNVEVSGTADASIAAAVNTLYIRDINGFTADRTLTLPATAAVGDRVGIVIETGDASFELLITATAGDTLNGIAGGTEWSRLFITGEVVIMRCVEANATWVVEQDGRIPCRALVYRNAAQSIVNATLVKIGLDTIVTNVGNIVDTANSRLVMRRAGDVEVAAALSYAGGIGAAAYAQTRIHKDGDTVNAISLMIMTHLLAATTWYPAMYCEVLNTTMVGGIYELYTYQNTGGSVALYVTEPVTWLKVTEVL